MNKLYQPIGTRFVDLHLVNEVIKLTEHRIVEKRTMSEKVKLHRCETNLFHLFIYKNSIITKKDKYMVYTT